MSRRAWTITAAIAVLLVAVLTAEIIATRPVREAVAAYVALLSAANRGDLEAASRLCTQHYLISHPLQLAPEGGIVGLPRNIHKNFQGWRHAGNVWLCPTNRVGPIYQFVFEAGAWRFDGPAGILRARGQVVPYSELTDVE